MLGAGQLLGPCREEKAGAMFLFEVQFFAPKGKNREARPGRNFRQEIYCRGLPPGANIFVAFSSFTQPQESCYSHYSLEFSPHFTTNVVAAFIQVMRKIETNRKRNAPQTIYHRSPYATMRPIRISARCDISLLVKRSYA